MSDPSETGGRPLALSIQQPEGSTQKLPALRRKRTRRSSQSSDERVGGTKSTSSRRRPEDRKETSLGPHTGSSRGDSSTMQRSHSPNKMSPDVSSVNYTKTGRISKAKKGLPVHNCECGRSYTRAEHLRRHQKNHDQNALVCQFPDCGKAFYRIDLLQRHQERHNEEKNSRRASYVSQGSTAEPEASIPAPVSVAPPIVTTVPQAFPPYQPTVTPLPEPTSDPRYTSEQFRTPQLPSSVSGHLRSSPSSNAIKQRPSYQSRQTSTATMALQIDGLQSDMTWTNPFGHPNYDTSSSSGYTSPVHYPTEANMFANPPYGPGFIRTRTSSNASFIEPWTYPPQSPTSATSTMGYTWASTTDKSPMPPNLPFLTSTYPVSGMPVCATVDPMADYPMSFEPKSITQRDEEEQVFMFPNEHFGTAHLANNYPYPYEQYLDNYWRLFHPSFPVVHRATFDGMNTSPMLRAAILAIGAQYSNDSRDKRHSRVLHDRARKVLEMRTYGVVTETDRLCDDQALLLLEVLSQYVARRAAKTLSPRFQNLYQKYSQNFGAVTSNIAEVLSAIALPENVTYERWSQWVELSSQQRILLCCYILESQQPTLLARQPQSSILESISGIDLPLPAHHSLWDALDYTTWGIAAQQHAHFPAYVYSVTADTSLGSLDTFQSSLLISCHYNRINDPTPYSSAPASTDIEHLLEASPITKHRLLTAKLLQVTPIRALIAVAGESWILSEKLNSSQAFSNCRTTIKIWLNALWVSPAEIQGPAAKEALKLAIEIMQHAMLTPFHDLRLEFGADMGLYFSSLVIWAVTVAANARINVPQSQGQPLRFHSHSPLPSHQASRLYPPTSTTQSANPAHPASIGLLSPTHVSPTPAMASSSMRHSDITMNALGFLAHAAQEIDFVGVVPQWPQQVVEWQQGSVALMHWVKMRLRSGAASEARDSVISVGPTSAATGRSCESLGELIDGVVSVLEKVIGRGWEGWGI